MIHNFYWETDLLNLYLSVTQYENMKFSEVEYNMFIFIDICTLNDIFRKTLVREKTCLSQSPTNMTYDMYFDWFWWENRILFLISRTYHYLLAH